MFKPPAEAKKKAYYYIPEIMNSTRTDTLRFLGSNSFLCSHSPYLKNELIGEV